MDIYAFNCTAGNFTSVPFLLGFYSLEKYAIHGSVVHVLSSLLRMRALLLDIILD